MADSTVQTLLDRGATSIVARTIRRCRSSGIVGHRPGLMLLAVAVHLAVRSVRVGHCAVCHRGAVGFDDGAGRIAAPLRFCVRALGGPLPWRGIRILHVARNARRHADSAQDAQAVPGSSIGRRRGCRKPASPRRATRSAAPVPPASFMFDMRGTCDARPGAARPRSFRATGTRRVRRVHQRRPSGARTPSAPVIRGTCQRTRERVAHPRSRARPDVATTAERRSGTRQER